MFRGCAEETGKTLANGPARHLEAVHLRNRRVKFGNRARGVFVLAIRREFQTRCARERLHIGNADECNLVSPGLQPAGERSHRIQVAGKGCTNKTNFPATMLSEVLGAGNLQQSTVSCFLERQALCRSHPISAKAEDDPETYKKSNGILRRISLREYADLSSERRHVGAYLRCAGRRVDVSER